eukprot:XP_001709260.1 Hypothetical protein GL50803_9717 [Giardia lamblia ATCC 50803]
MDYRPLVELTMCAKDCHMHKTQLTCAIEILCSIINQ